jgi:hypothetical protein
MVTPATPTTKQEPGMVVVFLKVSRATVEMLDDYRAGLRPVRSRASVARAALTEYLKQRALAGGPDHEPDSVRYRAEDLATWIESCPVLGGQKPEAR